MKKILIFLLLVSFRSFAQSEEEMNLVIDNYVVNGSSLNYAKVYEVPGLTSDEIKEKLIQAFTSKSKISLIQASISGNQFVAKLSDYDIDYKKYGLKWGNTVVFILHPLYADVTFQVKDGRYRVLVSNMKTANSSIEFELDDMISNGQLKGLHRPNLVKTYYALGMNLNDFFKLSEQIDNDW